MVRGAARTGKSAMGVGAWVRFVALRSIGLLLTAAAAVALSLGCDRSEC